jgi:hypothetical protein
MTRRILQAVEAVELGIEQYPYSSALDGEEGGSDDRHAAVS